MTHSHQDDAVRPAPIDCEATIRRLWDYLDGRLPEIARAEVEAHLEICAHCPRRFDFARTMQVALAASAPPAAASDEDRLRERVRVALRRLAVDNTG
jgi:anti-sigma factor RsiW